MLMIDLTTDVIIDILWNFDDVRKANWEGLDLEALAEFFIEVNGDGNYYAYEIENIFSDYFQILKLDEFKKSDDSLDYYNDYKIIGDFIILAR